jgi:hypothetical protein
MEEKPLASPTGFGDSEPFGSGAKEFLLVSALSALCLAASYLRTAPITPEMFALPWDWHKYIFMAEHGPLGFHVAPFCWRWLHPVLAGLLPWAIDRNFMIMALAETGISAALAYYIARAAGYSQMAGLTALLVFYSIPGAAKAAIAFPWGVDQLSRMFVLLGFLFLLKEKPWVASIAFAAGVCAKDTAVIAAPLFYTWYAGKLIDRPRLRCSVLYILPIAAMLIATRWAIPAWNDNASYIASLPVQLTQVAEGGTSFHYAELIRAMIRVHLSYPLSWSLKTMTVTSFGVFAILPLFAWKRNLPTLLRLLPFLVLTYAAMLWSSSTDRVLLIGLPAVELLALEGIRAISGFTKAPEAILAFAATPIFLITYIDPDSQARDPFELRAAILAVALLLMFLWRSRFLAARSQA